LQYFDRILPRQRRRFACAVIFTGFFFLCPTPTTLAAPDQLAQQAHMEANVRKADQILAAHPEKADVFAFRGESYKRLGKLDEALSDFSKAIQLDKKKDIYYHERATIYGLRRRFPEAVADMNQAIKLSPRNVDYFSYKGLLCSASGQELEAIQCFSQAIKLHANERDYCLRATVYIALNKMIEAKADLTEALKFDPNSAEAAKLKKELDSRAAATPRPKS
jgi:tetratricopeptide (TPR) repeat protein